MFERVRPNVRANVIRKLIPSAENGDACVRQLLGSLATCSSGLSRLTLTRGVSDSNKDRAHSFLYKTHENSVARFEQKHTLQTGVV